MKKMRYLMSDCGYSCADNVSSFCVESLTWNIPDSYFTKYSSYGFAFEEIVSYAYTHKADLPNFYEANGIKSCVRLNKMSINTQLLLTDCIRF